MGAEVAICEEPGGQPSGVVVGELTDAQVVHEICALAAGIDRASARMLVLIGELDVRSGRAWPGVLSCAHWVAWKLHINQHAARERRGLGAPRRTRDSVHD